MRANINGKRYDVRFVKGLREKGSLGECDPPWERGKQIRFDAGLTGRELLEVVIHEVRHAVDWRLDEDYVAEEASDLASLLWELRDRIFGG